MEIRLNLMGLFEARMNGEWASEDQCIIFDGLLSVTSIKEWRWRQGKTGFRRSMDYLRWAFVGGKYRKMAMEAWGNGLQKINGLSSMGFWWWQVSKNGDGSMGERASEDQMDNLQSTFGGGTHRRTAMESIENGLLRFAAFAEIIQSLFEQPHAEELEDAEVDAAH